MNRIALTGLLLVVCAAGMSGQTRPKLVVGILIDQMRWDYLTRYEDRYGEGGFKRLMSEGYNCNRTLIDYLPAVTAVGHTSAYTGSVPALTGIVGNNFLKDGRMTYCCTDTTVTTVASPFAKLAESSAGAGMMSPRNLFVTTITDELRLATNFRSKTIGVALKDRASILPAGHAANGAYWFDDASNTFISSTYYMERLPEWADNFNKTIDVKKALKELGHTDKRNWKLLYDEDSYVQSTPVNTRYEYPVGDNAKNSPYGITLTFGMAEAAIEGERLGNNVNGVPDFLAVSISSTDIIGHQVGPNSIWIEDLYLRLDRELASFFSYLDGKIGKDNYIVFLSADHAAGHNVTFMNDNKLPAYVWDNKNIQDGLDRHIETVLGATERIARCVGNFQIKILDDKVKALNLKRHDVENAVTEYMKSLPFVVYAFPMDDIPDFIPQPIRDMAINGYYPKRCGDIQVIPQNGTMERDPKDPKGTNHAIWSPYDTHIPLIFMGKGIPAGQDEATHHMTDIAPTIASLLRIQQPSGCVGHAIRME